MYSMTIKYRYTPLIYSIFKAFKSIFNLLILIFKVQVHYNYDIVFFPLNPMYLMT